MASCLLATRILPEPPRPRVQDPWPWRPAAWAGRSSSRSGRAPLRAFGLPPTLQTRCTRRALQVQPPCATALDEEGYEAAPAITGGEIVARRGSIVVRAVDLRPPADTVAGTASMELREVAALQASAFHEPKKIAFLNDLSRRTFQAEVLDALKKKCAVTGEGEYVCLVAEEEGGGGIIGVVEVSLLCEDDVRRVMMVDSYLYLSCMAVAEGRRREGIASLLMEAAEAAAAVWGSPGGLVLHVYDDNPPAVDLYSGAGYIVQGEDPDWTKMLGKRRRLCMARTRTTGL